MFNVIRLSATVAILGTGLCLPGCTIGASLPHPATATQEAKLSKASDRANSDSEPVVGIWVSSPSQNAIFGQTKGGKRTLALINTALNSCFIPGAVKVDRQENLWVACESTYATSSCYYPCAGSVQIYAPAASAPSVTYADSLGYCSRSYCYSTFATATDVALDSRGHVFAANPAFGSCTIGHVHLCTWGPAAYISYWREGRPSKTVHFVYVSELGTARYLDADPAGNLYVGGTAYQCYGSSCENIIVEVRRPTGSGPIITEILSSADQLGGVYVSNAGTVLNIVDQTARTVSQYALPWVAGETPFNVLGPTLEQTGKGEPTSGGFDQKDRSLVLGDAAGWIDIGNVAKNRWSAVGNRNLSHGNAGAAYVPSDK